jgi:transcriptional regulator with XRE-family HTH domain
MTATTVALRAPRSRVPVVPGPVVPLLIFGLEVGTGGAVTIDYLRTKGSKGYQSPWLDVDREVHSTRGATASPADNLARIRSVLRTSVADLARALGVSRQAIYDWQTGRPIAADNAARLQDIADAADLFAREGLHATAHVMRRPISNRKNFFEIIRDGGSAEAAARTLIDIVRRELKQRENLKSRLADRAGPTREDFQDLGMPMLDEKG